MSRVFQLLSEEILMGDDERPAKVYAQWDRKTVRYVLVYHDDSSREFYESTKHPEDLTPEERHRVLDACLSSFDDDEIVNYFDLILQFEFVKKVEEFDDYTLTDEWLEY